MLLLLTLFLCQLTCVENHWFVLSLILFQYVRSDDLTLPLLAAVCAELVER